MGAAAGLENAGVELVAVRMVGELREQAIGEALRAVETLRDALGVRNETLGAALQRLLDAKRLVRTADGLAAVPVPR